jgi:hypothetical protein
MGVMYDDAAELNVPFDGGNPAVASLCTDVLHGGEDVLRVAAGDLVAHGDVAEGNAGEVGDVALDPRGGGVGVRREGGQVLVAHVHDEADVAVAQGLQRIRVGEVDAHGVDAVGLVHLHHVGCRGEVVADHAVAHADGSHACTWLSSNNYY